MCRGLRIPIIVASGSTIIGSLFSSRTLDISMANLTSLTTDYPSVGNSGFTGRADVFSGLTAFASLITSTLRRRGGWDAG